MAADISGGHGQPDPSWWQMGAGILGMLGAPVLLQKLLDYFSGRKKAGAEAELALAQARESEVRAEEAANSRAGDFEKAVNERVKAVLDSWERQVAMLTARMQAQEREIRDLRDEVIALRKALDAAARPPSPPPGIGI